MPIMRLCMSAIRSIMVAICCCIAVPAAPQPWPERRGVRGVLPIGVAKRRQGLTLLTLRQPHVHQHQDGEHEQRQQRRPLQQKPEQDQDKPGVLRVPQPGVWAGDGQGLLLLRLIEHSPSRGQQDEPAADE